MARRPRGCIREHQRARGTRYEVVMNLGRDPLTGRRLQPSRTYATLAEAEKALTAWQADVDRGLSVPSAPETVGQVLAYWLQTRGPQLRESTRVSYEGVIRLHLTPFLGQIKVQRLTPPMVQASYAQMQREGRSARTVGYAHTILAQALKQARLLGLLARHPLDGVSAPRRERREMTCWTRAEARAFLDVALSSPHAALWALLLDTGMRRGEALGLRWRDVDLENGALSVRQTSSAIKGRMVFGPPKTAAGRRMVTLAPTVVDLLRRQRTMQRELRLAAGPLWREQGLVFTREDGAPLPAGRLDYERPRLMAQAGVPRIRLHDLRHTHVTLQLSSGAPLAAVSKRIGHSRVSVTQNVYQHVTPDEFRELARRSETLFFEPPEDQS